MPGPGYHLIEVTPNQYRWSLSLRNLDWAGASADHIQGKGGMVWPCDVNM